jgi:hypothetical protein
MVSFQRNPANHAAYGYLTYISMSTIHPHYNTVHILEGLTRSFLPFSWEKSRTRTEGELPKYCTLDPHQL